MSLISQNNFIFIHIYKCGGMTLRKVLEDKLCAVEFQHSHATAQEIKSYCYATEGRFFWHTAYKFSIVRNPFDWVVSLYEFIRGNSNHVNYDEVKDMDFEQFCQWNVDCVRNKKQNPNGTFNTQTEFLYDVNGNLLVDFVGRMENYEEDVRVIMNKLNIPEREIPRVNASKREPDYRTYYNERSKAIIADGFYHDLVNFNYTF